MQLEESALFPGGGGQPADHGTLRDGDAVWQVTGAKLARDGTDPAFPAPGVWTLLDRAAPAVGTDLEGEVEWERRYQLMRTHTALHILCAVVWRDYRAKVTGANMEPLKGRMDFEFDALSGEFVRELEEKVNVEVAAARPTRVDFLPRAGGRPGPGADPQQGQPAAALDHRRARRRDRRAGPAGRRRHACRQHARGGPDRPPRVQEQGQDQQAR